MKKMFNFVLIIAFIAALFTSCHEDPQSVDYSKITGIVNEGNSYNNRIDSVYAFIYTGYLDNGNYQSVKSEVIAKAKFQNGGFILQLPPLSNEQLYTTIGKIYTDTVIISDKNVRVNFLNLKCISDGYNIGAMFYHNNLNRLDSGYLESEYIYCDKPVTINGSTKASNWYSFTTHYYAINLKKGWNILTKKMRNNGIEFRTNFSSNDPSADEKWYPSIIMAR